MGRMMNSDIFLVNILHAEAATRCVLLKRRSLKFRETHRNTPVPDPVFFNKVAGLRHRCFFSVNFAKFLRTPFLIEHHWWLLLFM